MTSIQRLLMSSCAAIFVSSGASAAMHDDLFGSPKVAKPSYVQMACNSCDWQKERKDREASRKGQTRTRAHNGDIVVKQAQLQDDRSWWEVLTSTKEENERYWRNQIAKQRGSDRDSDRRRQNGAAGNYGAPNDGIY